MGDVTGRFADIVSGPEEGLDLAEAALLIAAHAQRAVDTYVEGGGGGVSSARMVPSFTPG